jgi:hypothetical protein
MNISRLLPLAGAALLLTGCTDIRNRLSPDVLAVHIAGQTEFAVHDAGLSAPLTAFAPEPGLLCDALRRASGEEVSTGHLTLLAVSGDPAAVLPAWFSQRWIAPTCAVLVLRENACSALRSGSLPTPQQLSAAVSTGALPCRTADAVTGDLWGGSGVTALHCLDAGRLTLLLRGSDTEYGTLSEDACRGLALLGRRWEHFTAAAGNGTVFSVQRASLHIAAAENEGRLRFTVRGQIFCSPADSAAAETLCRMLTAALTESAGGAGADLNALRESAIRDGIGAAAQCTQAQWREMLMQAEYAAEPDILSAL